MLIIDGIINLALGVLLVIFPTPIILALPLPGTLFLWALVILLVGLSAIEFVARR